MTLLFLSCLCYCSPKKYVSFFIYFILCYTFILLHVLLYPHHNTNYFFLNKKLIMGIMVITILLIWRRAFLYRFGCQKVFLAVLPGRPFDTRILYVKKRLHKSGSKSYFYAIIVLLAYAPICKPMRKHKTYLFLL